MNPYDAQADSTLLLRSYDYLVVAPGLKSDFEKVDGLVEALKDPKGTVSSIYSFGSVEKAWQNIKDFKSGDAVR